MPPKPDDVPPPGKPKCPHPAIFVIYGAGGDLTQRKLIPALYNLFLDGWLPPRFAVVGISSQETSDDQFRGHLRAGVDEFSRSGKSRDDQWHAFSQHLFSLTQDITAADSYTDLREWLERRERDWDTRAVHVFYLAVPPSLFEPISCQLGRGGLLADRDQDRLVLEKPFGHDLESARRLNEVLAGEMRESQVYRIDHYLGKETVQNILALRFANSIFEPIWNRRYIDHVQITVAEEVGVEGRAGYYEQAGALRDMVQNHLLQILCHVAMEPPVAFVADEIRNKKADVLRAVRPIQPAEVAQQAVRGQYGPGELRGRAVPGYRQEPGVAPNSSTETYAALKLFIDNWRWQGVPFYLRTGKRMPGRVSEASIQFRGVPHRSFPMSAESEMEPNCLTIRVVPNEGIVLRFQAKFPGHRLLLKPVYMRFNYQESFAAPAREAYETLLRDAMLGDATLFMRADQVEAAWAVVEPVMRAWAASPPADFPNYAAGSWGPAAADELLAPDSDRWLVLMDGAGPHAEEQPK